MLERADFGVLGAEGGLEGAPRELASLSLSFFFLPFFSLYFSRDDLSCLSTPLVN